MRVVRLREARLSFFFVVVFFPLMFYLSRSFGYLTVMCIRRRRRREALSSLINVLRFDTEQKDVIVQKRLKRKEGKERLCGEGCGS